MVNEYDEKKNRDLESPRSTKLQEDWSKATY